jgi:hypothetical protein
MKNKFIIFLLLLVSCEKETYDIKCVKRGSHIFYPAHVLKPNKPKSFDGYVMFDESAIFNSLQDDNRDWNKLCGIYNFYDFKMNKNSFILAWRPSGKQIELCLYENINNEIYQHNLIYKAEINKNIYYKFLFFDGKYSLSVDSTLMGVQKNPITYKNIENIFTWFGGNRKAPQDICIKFF